MSDPTFEITDQPIETLELADVGVQGPPGAPGTPAVGYVFTQAAPATAWIVAHNLGYRPMVMVCDVNWNEIDVAIHHDSVNQFTVQPDVAVAGFAVY